MMAQPADRISETQFSLPENEQDNVDDHDSNRAGEQNGNASSAKVCDHGERPPVGYGAIAATQANGSPDESSASKAATSTQRALAPDLLRGLLMVLQAVDHSALSVGAWRHGTGIESEGDGVNVDTWNITAGWVARMLTHLCAPGFMFLLGMGVVYFGRSRSKLGWTSSKMAYHFAVRGVVLAAVSEVLGWVIGRGKILILNIVLLALAADYLFAGMIWLGLVASERWVATMIDSSLMSGTIDADEARPLMGTVTEGHGPKTTSRGFAISWHLHNFALLSLSITTIWWNIWLSPDHGRCTADTSDSSKLVPGAGSANSYPALDFWFFSVQNGWIVSPFPPLAWLSFAILGILYARIVLSRPWSTSAVTAGNMSAGVVFALLFVITRVANFGNLSKDCLHMPEQVANPDKNQYLVSFRSFFYVIKYPPDPAYFAYTMSFNFFLLAFFGALPTSVARRIPGLMTFGTSALFFYVLHLVIYFSIGAGVKAWFGHDLGYTDPFTHQPAVGVGNSLAFWLTWILGLGILYPSCRWYGAFKSSKGPSSVWRFF